jgi:hypothetical protein
MVSTPSLNQLVDRFVDQTVRVELRVGVSCATGVQVTVGNQVAAAART